MKVIWETSDYDADGNPKPEAIKRAMEYRKPLPWWRVLGIVWMVLVVATMADKAFAGVVGVQYAWIIFGIMAGYVFLWAGNADVRRVTRRFLGWLVP